MAEPLQTILARYTLSRRKFAGGMVLAAGVAMTSRAAFAESALSSDTTLGFTEIEKSTDIDFRVAPGYQVQKLVSWGDALGKDSKLFDFATWTPEKQAKAVGDSNDYLAFFPLPPGSMHAESGILHINNEFPSEALKDSAIMQQAVGFTTIEIARTDSGWAMVKGSKYNRRVTATTPIAISGPAKGDARMQTSADPKGIEALGTFGNCAGGITPWGTALSCEENFDEFFANAPQNEANKRYGLPKGKSEYGWETVDERFDVAKHPNEPHRFGWVVEYDPYDPQSKPVKRTALGRFKHESASCTLAPDGRVVVYSGDDEVFQYLYRFVSHKAYDAADPAANKDVLDEGTLSVARFSDDGSMQWIPLVYGQLGLDEAHGFTNQADVLIDARRAGDVVGATPMDRPEDIEVNHHTATVYVALTNNKKRKDTNAANRRAANIFGHIIELIPPGGNHAAERFSWGVFLEAGNPKQEAHAASYLSQPSTHGWLTCPDNLAVDGQGRLWIATDGQPHTIGRNDGLYATDCIGPARGQTRMFFSVPAGAETTGPCFTPDGTTLFVSVQHPGIDMAMGWPDFKEGIPPRSSVVAITHKDGKVIGS